MNLEIFATNLAATIFIDPAFNEKVITAGISWKELGDLCNNNLFSTDVPKFISIVRERGLKVAAHEMRESIKLVDAMGGAPSKIPSDEDILAAEYQKYLTDQKVRMLGKELTKNPSSYQAQIDRFYLKFTNVESFDVYSGVEAFLPQEKFEAEMGRAVVKIPRYPKLSEMIGGFNPGRIGMLLGSSGLGKTNCALNLALSAAETMGVCYVNMEMVPRDIVRRLAVIRSRIGYREFFGGGYSVAEVASQFLPIKGNMAITGGRPLSVQQIKSWTKSRHFDVGLLIVDYDLKLELPYDRNTPEWKQIQQAIIDLETFAKDEGLYVLMLSQINRDEQIASSYRAIYSAHTVLKFQEDKEKGFIIVAEKNRHGRKNAALAVNYTVENSNIDEVYDFIYSQDKRPKPIAGIQAPYPYKD
jgi:hypothetical protein